MTRAATNSSLPKSRGQVILEYVLLAVCLCAIALRTTFTEGPAAQSTGQPINLSDPVYSLSVSAALIFSFVIWFVRGFCSKKFPYRFTGIELGLLVFSAGGIAAGLLAPNKRAAITGFATLLAPILMAVLLVQILDSQSKVRLVLVVIAALGIVSAYQCAYQFFVTNQIEIEQYEEAPETKLVPLGIRPNTLAQWQFEHRLYSRGVSGFFTTSNSAGSFSLLALFAALALFIDRIRNCQAGPSRRISHLACGTAVALVLFGLVVTRSKGAILAALLAATMFAAYLFFAGWLKAYKRIVIVVCLAVFLAVGCGVVLYGRTHGRLPGGNSMLVRWQYWHASAKMYRDHPLTGVGPGNFAGFYPRYKVPSALETVSDPHNFLLAVLTQFGPLGLFGFLAMVFLPLARVLSPGSEEPSSKASSVGPAFKKLAVAFALVISAALLIIRPIIMPFIFGDSLDVLIYAIFALYVAPVAAFAVGLWLLTTNGKTAEQARPDVTSAALFCGVCGFLIHNLIDFAIFEPGLFTCFWAIVACLIVSGSYRRPCPQAVLKPSSFVRISAVAAGLVLVWACLGYALTPVARATAGIGRALREPEYGHELLDQAAQADRLDPAALNLNGRLYLQHYEETGRQHPDLLRNAERCFLAAIERNEADFKNFERLTEVYVLLGETATQQERTYYLNRAFESARAAVERYPGSGRLRIELAKIAEQSGKNDVAVVHYKKAIEIEDSYREQFRLMYPGQEVFSRLGEEKYLYAKQRIEQLTKSSSR
ncbi:MAG: O-antigen ligase family protein [Planctomycetota bacterium]|jgi:hypothetical protein